MSTKHAQHAADLTSEIIAKQRAAKDRLIAAAPELLDALKEAAKWIGDGEYSEDRGNMAYAKPLYANACKKVMTAILKATGETEEKEEK